MKYNQMRTIPCKGCARQIGFIETPTGKFLPVDPDAIHFDECEEAETLIMTDGTTYRVNPEHKYPQEESFGYRPHWATCPKADSFRRVKK